MILLCWKQHVLQSGCLVVQRGGCYYFSGICTKLIRKEILGISRSCLTVGPGMQEVNRVHHDRVVVCEQRCVLDLLPQCFGLRVPLVQVVAALGSLECYATIPGVVGHQLGDL